MHEKAFINKDTGHLTLNLSYNTNGLQAWLSVRNITTKSLHRWLATNPPIIGQVAIPFDFTPDDDPMNVRSEASSPSIIVYKSRVSNEFLRALREASEEDERPVIEEWLVYTSPSTSHEGMVRIGDARILKVVVCRETANTHTFVVVVFYPVGIPNTGDPKQRTHLQIGFSEEDAYDMREGDHPPLVLEELT
jgi:hypothetical protein